jgi:serine/threonine protein kinase
MALAGPDSDQDRTVIANGHGSATLRPGSKILNDTYVIERLLGKGGMGEVYEAEHIELGAKRAIKIILPEYAKNTQYVGLFIEEARKLSRVNNDAVVRYYEFSRDESGARYLVMEFVEGQSLAAVLEQQRFEPAEVLGLCERLAQGLAAAYDQGIRAHRDISPANILLPQARADQAKVIDFGIAKSADPGGVTLIGSDFAGKYSFVSPEQVGLFGGQEEVTEKSDIYSLGLLLAAAGLGFGKRLDMGNEPASVIRARQSVPDLSALPAELRPLLSRMLQPRPQDRPASMRAVLDETHRLTQRRSGSTPSAQRARSRQQRRIPLWRIASGVAVVALIAVGTVVGLWLKPFGNPPPPTSAAISTPTPPPLQPPVAAVPPSPTEPPAATVPPPPTPPSPSEPSAPPATVPPSSEPPVAAVPPPPMTPPSPSEPSAPPATVPPSPPATPPTIPPAEPAAQPAVLPPPPAPPSPPDSRTALSNALKQLDCASLHSGTSSDGRALISGSVSDAEDQAKLLAIAAQIPSDARPLIQVEIVPPPVCRSIGTFDALRADGLVAAGGIELHLANGGGTLHEGDPIGVEVKSLANYPVNLRIDYFTLGGEVLHMWPNPDFPTAELAAGASREFLKSGPGNKVWQIGGAPFGSELIAVTATAAPLDLGTASPAVEPAADYLRRLNSALRQATTPAGQPSLAATVLVHTGEKQ